MKKSLKFFTVSLLTLTTLIGSVSPSRAMWEEKRDVEHNGSSSGVSGIGQQVPQEEWEELEDLITALSHNRIQSHNWDAASFLSQGGTTEAAISIHDKLAEFDRKQNVEASNAPRKKSIQEELFPNQEELFPKLVKLGNTATSIFPIIEDLKEGFDPMNLGILRLFSRLNQTCAEAVPSLYGDISSLVSNPVVRQHILKETLQSFQGISNPENIKNSALSALNLMIAWKKSGIDLPPMAFSQLMKFNPETQQELQEPLLYLMQHATANPRDLFVALDDLSLEKGGIMGFTTLLPPLISSAFALFKQLEDRGITIENGLRLAEISASDSTGAGSSSQPSETQIIRPLDEIFRILFEHRSNPTFVDDVVDLYAEQSERPLLDVLIDHHNVKMNEKEEKTQAWNEKVSRRIQRDKEEKRRREQEQADRKLAIRLQEEEQAIYAKQLAQERAALPPEERQEEAEPGILLPRPALPHRYAGNKNALNQNSGSSSYSQGVNVHDKERDYAARYVLECLLSLSHVEEANDIDTNLRAFEEYLTEYAERNPQKGELAQQAWNGKKQQGQSFGNLSQDDTFSIGGFYVNPRELMATLWNLTSSLEDPDRTNARESIMSALAEREAGNMVCNPGKVQRLIVAVMGYVEANKISDPEVKHIFELACNYLNMA